MYLLKEPYQPTYSYYRSFYQYLQNQESWRKFIPGGDSDFGYA